MAEVRKLDLSDLEGIINVEKRAFISQIQASRKKIAERINKGHIYLGAFSEESLVGTLALRFARFLPNFKDFINRNSSFHDYAESDNEDKANAVFVYSLGVIPEHRNASHAVKLIRNAVDIGREEGMEFLVGDARVPSYNGSHNQIQYEEFDRNEKLHNAIDKYIRSGILPSRELIEQDSVAGFYLRVFPTIEVLGITDEKFWEGDEPCGGHMLIEYSKLK
ncbi:MAG: GNAT family N-acetyltransferase [Nanoarchaeota archaeon]|nr:GNAT family N-acetyltransferase [Nanoarchaeota archaeon]